VNIASRARGGTVPGSWLFLDGCVTEGRGGVCLGTRELNY
jgi:hypothetical protein